MWALKSGYRRTFSKPASQLGVALATRVAERGEVQLLRRADVELCAGSHQELSDLEMPFPAGGVEWLSPVHCARLHARALSDEELYRFQMASFAGSVQRLCARVRASVYQRRLLGDEPLDNC